MSLPTCRFADRRPNPAIGVETLEDRVVPDATMLDLTARGSVGTINGAYFRQYDARPTGTGAIDSFLRVQGASAKGAVQQGYNTDARPLQFDENKSPQFTRSLRVGDVPEVNIGGRMYKEFLLDINQKSSQPYLSLDQVQVFVGSKPNLTGYDSKTQTLPGAALAYNMDAGGDNWVKLDYRLNTGSGSGDMLMYVPADMFNTGSYIYLYSRFGEHYAANAGFQEWARGTGVPLAVAAGASAGSIGGTVYRDLDNFGVRDDFDTGIPGAVVYLDANGNGQYDADVEVYQLTDQYGHYLFDHLATGPDINYVVRVVDKGDDMMPLYGEMTTDLPPVINLAQNEHRTDVDFGFKTDTE